MRYTQLEFALYSASRRTLLEQARWLLHELIEGRRHEFPCDCGACIYAAYLRRKKDEGRSFSKRTFFMYFLWIYFFRATLYDRRLSSRGSLIPLKGKPGAFYWQSSLGKIADKRRLDLWEKRDLKRQPRILSTNIFREKVESITRRRTRAMIKRLAEGEKGRRAKMFLGGILNKKRFYTYYVRAANRDLYKIVMEVRHELQQTPPIHLTSAESGLYLGCREKY